MDLLFGKISRWYPSFEIFDRAFCTDNKEWKLEISLDFYNVESDDEERTTKLLEECQESSSQSGNTDEGSEH